MTDKKPRHLDEQMLYEFKEAVYGARKLLSRKFGLVGLDSNFEAKFRNKFEFLRAETLKKMVDDDRRGLDPHKIAAVACLAVLLSRPLLVPKNGEAHAVNETVAYLLVANIIRNYQIKKRTFPADQNKQAQLRDLLGAMDMPPLIYDTQPVVINTIFALRELSRSVRKSTSPVDFVFILSSFFFFIDSYSYTRVKEIADTLLPYG